jgi:hypothetical protein
MMTAEVISRNVVHATSVDALDADLVNEHVNRDAFAAIRGVFSRDDMAAVLERVRAGFDPARDQPSIGESPAAVMDNFQKLSIGGAGSHWDYRPRFMRVIYNPLWAEDRYGMHATFRTLAQIRNALQGNPPNYAVDQVEDGVWTAARMQHYPGGGGNISRHRDAVISTVTSDAGVKRFHQMLLLLTSKGEHFETGGAYMEFGDEVVDLEDEFKAGDIIVYDGRTMHGVHDIDPHKVASLTAFDGRLVASVSLYKDMSAQAKPYAGYEGTFVDAEKPPE